MKKVRNIILIALSMVLVAAIAISGTVAYLTHATEKVNVMEFGDVSIEILEYERKVNADGSWIASSTADRYGYYPDELQEFTQDKPLIPVVLRDGDYKWDDRNGSQDPSGPLSHQQSWGQVGASGSHQLFDDSVKNVQDKFVFIKNTGHTNAYVRTFYAFEKGGVTLESEEFFDNYMRANRNVAQWSWEIYADNFIIDGNNYLVYEATYLGPASNPTGILAPGAVSYPGLLQVYLKPMVDKAECDMLDGNDNGKYDVLVFAQSVQADGFANAESAFDAAFGNTLPFAGSSAVTDIADDAADVVDVIDNVTAGEKKVILLSNDVDMGETPITVPADADVTINLNGKTLEAEYDADGHFGTFNVAVGSELTIEGNGEVVIDVDLDANRSGCIFQNDGILNIYGGTYILRHEKSLAGMASVAALIDNCVSGGDAVVNIYGGTFGIEGNGAVNLIRNWPISNGTATLNIYGGTFLTNPEKTTTYIWNKNDTNRANARAYVNVYGGEFENVDGRKIVVEVDGFLSDVYIAPGVENLEIVEGSICGFVTP